MRNSRYCRRTRKGSRKVSRKGSKIKRRRTSMKGGEKSVKKFDPTQPYKPIVGNWAHNQGISERMSYDKKHRYRGPGRWEVTPQNESVWKSNRSKSTNQGITFYPKPSTASAVSKTRKVQDKVKQRAKWWHKARAP